MPRALPLVLALVVLVLLVLVLVLGTAAAPGDPPAAAAPRISFEAKEIDFGKIIVGDAVDRVFRFKNQGGAPLLIRRVKPSCGCTAALLSKGEIAPGGEGEISVHFDSKDRQGFQTIEVHVFSNDGVEKDMGDNVSVLRLKGEVTHLLAVMPMSFYFPSFARGSPEGQNKRITVLTTEPARREVRAIAVTTTSRFLEARLEPLERGGRKGFDVVLSIAKDVPIGRVDGQVIVQTDHPQQPVLRIPVIGAARGPIVWFPERLSLLGQEGEKEPAIQVMRMEGDGGLAIESVETPPQFEAEIVEMVPGKRLEIGFHLKPDARPGPFSGRVRIFLRSADQPLIEVPITGEVPRRVGVEPPAAWFEGALRPARFRVTGATPSRVEVAAAPFTVRHAAGSDEVFLEPADAMKPGPFAGLLRIHFASHDTLEVPLRGELAVGK